MYFSKTENNIRYIDKKMLELTEEELKNSSDLFSENYGVYSNSCANKAGQQIKMGVSYYKKHYLNDDYRIAMAYNGDSLIGHAIYIKKVVEEDIKMSWVIQLVVHNQYRGKGIGTRLLHSIWGFSNYSAWGLATANPCTVKVLENATLRRANPKIISQNLDKIKLLSSHIDFASDFEVTEEKSVLKSNFFVEHGDIKNNIDKIYDNWILGDLNEGEEWLAFTFKDQDIDEENYLKNFNRFIEFSEIDLMVAYSRMDLSNQNWNKHQETEVKHILELIDKSKIQKIYDFGCGNGRHSIEFAKRGYNVLGIDFVDRNIERANNNANILKKDIKGTLNFIEGDCRNIKLQPNADLILALYDVIGSFPNDSDNNDIIKNANKLLKVGGYFILSVMNMEMTSHIAKYKVDSDTDLPNMLLNLKPCNIMQSSGNVFNPEYFILDKKNGLVYRKEQFDEDGDLSAEYVIRDKRYTFDEIDNLLKHSGFVVEKSSYVQAGKFDTELEATDYKAKEIFIVAKKLKDINL